jgi:hypothetical protein
VAWFGLQRHWDRIASEQRRAAFAACKERAAGFPWKLTKIRALFQIDQGSNTHFMRTHRPRATPLVRVILGLLILPNVTLLPWLTSHYQKICPKKLDEERGVIYPLNEHGSIVYLTLEQHRKMLAGNAYLVGSVFCFFAVGMWIERGKTTIPADESHS